MLPKVSALYLLILLLGDLYVVVKKFEFFVVILNSKVVPIIFLYSYLSFLYFSNFCFHFIISSSKNGGYLSGTVATLYLFLPGEFSSDGSTNLKLDIHGISNRLK